MAKYEFPGQIAPTSLHSFFSSLSQSKTLGVSKYTAAVACRHLWPATNALIGRSVRNQRLDLDATLPNFLSFSSLIFDWMPPRHPSPNSHICFSTLIFWLDVNVRFTCQVTAQGHLLLPLQQATDWLLDNVYYLCASVCFVYFNYLILLCFYICFIKWKYWLLNNDGSSLYRQHLHTFAGTRGINGLPGMPWCGIFITIPVDQVTHLATREEALWEWILEMGDNCG